MYDAFLYALFLILDKKNLSLTLPFHSYGDVVCHTRNFRNDSGKPLYPLNRLIVKGYQFKTIVLSLNIVLSLFMLILLAVN